MMIKKAALPISILANIFLVALIWQNETVHSGERMSCAEAVNEHRNKQATLEYARSQENSLVETHRFLRASDYTLRNIASYPNGEIVFVYTAKRYPKTCKFPLPTIDGTIVRVVTDMSTEPKVLDVR